MVCTSYEVPAKGDRRINKQAGRTVELSTVLSLKVDRKKYGKVVGGSQEG